MKDKVFLILGIFVLLAGCASTQTGGGGATATQTATDLVRALGGASTAKANGDTVMLTGEVWPKTDLTVPEGVTLDLMTDGAVLGLQDGAILTVNGTMNVRGHSQDNKGSLYFDGRTVINGSGTINLKSKGGILSLWSGDGHIRSLILDGVSLVGLPDNSESLVWVGEDSEFLMKSGAIIGNTRTSDDWAAGGGVDVWRGTFTMEGGEISSNSVVGTRGSSGGGVNVSEGSIFNMTGGMITDNTATGGDNSSGGGVRVGDGCTFTMSGGVISGNSTPGSGGGVAVGEGAFTMEGGEISGNSVIAREAKGGGVIVFGGIFTMYGGAIYGNSVQGSVMSQGGGVTIDQMMSGKGAFIMYGGRIQGSTDSDGFAANTSRNNVALADFTPVAKWGIGGTYTKGGASKVGGTDIGSTDDTLIAIPAP